jgi:hypothetical protein
LDLILLGLATKIDLGSLDICAKGHLNLHVVLVRIFGSLVDEFGGVLACWNKQLDDLDVDIDGEIAMGLIVGDGDSLGS